MMLKTTFIFLILIHIFGSLTLASISPLIRQRFGFNKNPKQENVFGKRNSSFRDWINASLRGADIAKKDGGSRRSENANEEVLVKTDQVVNGEEGTVEFFFRNLRLYFNFNHRIVYVLCSVSDKKGKRIYTSKNRQFFKIETIVAHNNEIV